MPEFHLSLDAGGFSDLPWDKPLDLWAANCRHVVELPRGISRHPVVFVNLVGLLYALKYLPNGIGFQEHKILKQAEELRLPAVQPLGVVVLDQGGEILVTRYLERSLPYRSLYMSAALGRYREHLINAMANLLVQLHNSGYFWGDCSLSNTPGRSWPTIPPSASWSFACSSR